jgi:hypothetical protein
MPRYSVQLPVTGYVIKEVEADSEESAIEAAMAEGSELSDIEEWNTHKRVAYGNVCSAIDEK